MRIITLECLAWRVFELGKNTHPHFYAFLTEGWDTGSYLLKVSHGSEIQLNRELKLRRKRLPPGKGHRQSTERKPGGPLVPGHPGKPFTPLDPSSPSAPGSPVKEERGKGNTHTHTPEDTWLQQWLTGSVLTVGCAHAGLQVTCSRSPQAFVLGAISLEKHSGDVLPHFQRCAYSNRVGHSVWPDLL